MYGSTVFPVAVHAMTSIAVLTEKYGRASASSETIARSIDTNAVVVRRILARLHKAGLVRITRGKEGGYHLARAAASITLSDILVALGDEPLFYLHPRAGAPHCEVARSIKGVLAPILDESERALHRSLTRVTLGSLMAKMS
jgi:Rrf2 family protein